MHTPFPLFGPEPSTRTLNRTPATIAMSFASIFAECLLTGLVILPSALSVFFQFYRRLLEGFYSCILRTTLCIVTHHTSPSYVVIHHTSSSYIVIHHTSSSSSESITSISGPFRAGAAATAAEGATTASTAAAEA